MNDEYHQFQIRVSQLNLPERTLSDSVVISNISGREDYHKLVDLFLKIFPDEIDSEKATDFRELQILETEGNFLAKSGQELIGFLITGIINQVGYISYIGVLDEFRSQGIATALLKGFKSHLNEKMVEKVRCKIKKDNKKTLEYIIYLGFQRL